MSLLTLHHQPGYGYDFGHNLVLSVHIYILIPRNRFRPLIMAKKLSCTAFLQELFDSERQKLGSASLVSSCGLAFNFQSSTEDSAGFPQGLL